MAKAKIGNSSKGVYILLENRGNNRYYVGSSMDLKTRFKSYRHKQRGKRMIDYSINKYGFDSFFKYVIEFKEDISENELRMWEGFYIRLLGSYHYENEFGMNLIKNPTMSPSCDINVKKKISESLKGIKRDWLSERNKGNKFALGRTGEKHHFSKRVINLKTNTIFESIKDLADYNKTNRTSMKNIINKNQDIYKYL